MTEAQYDSSLFAFNILVPLLLVMSVIESKANAGEALPIVELGPMLGYVGLEEAHIWIKASAPATGGVIVAEGANPQTGRAVTGPDLTARTDYMGVIKVLRLATRYSTLTCSKLSAKNFRNVRTSGVA